MRTLMEHDLVDELRLMIHMRLLDTRTVGDGLAFLAYEVVRKR